MTTSLVAALTGMPPPVRSAIIWTLTDAGFPRPDAEAWANGWAMNPDPALVAHQAIAYDDHGIPIDHAIDWHQHGFLAHEAICLHDNRWQPADAATARDLTYNHNLGDLDDWITTGLPAHRVIAYLHAQVHVDEVDTYEAQPGGSDDALGMLAGLLG
ncbi:hypothetical protein ABFT23_02250 [Nocardioides sp. C4-1]|uniref:hypothetical protein n=1 Tax=Nocardioides sp. C4-1 TaxID=3151851 RepID=UPI0032670D14